VHVCVCVCVCVSHPELLKVSCDEEVCVQDKDVKKDIVHNHKSLSCFCNSDCKTCFNFICLIHLNLLMHHA